MIGGRFSVVDFEDGEGFMVRNTADPPDRQQGKRPSLYEKLIQPKF
jgi:hypothetical protein